MLKDTPPEKLLDAITIVAAGEALLAPAITRRLIAEFARQPRAAARPAGTLSRSSPSGNVTCSSR